MFLCDSIVNIEHVNAGWVEALWIELCSNLLIWSVIRQKGESQNGCFKKQQSTVNFPKNEHFLPLDTHTFCLVTDEFECLENSTFLI